MEYCPIILERTCCEKAAAIAEISGAETESVYQRFAALRTERLARKDAVMSELESLIAEHLEDGKLYYALLKLKRSIFNERHDRVLSDLNKIPDAENILGEQICRYIDLVTQESEAQAAWEASLSETVLKTRRVMKQIFRENQDLYTAVMHISPTIYHQMDKYLSAEEGKEKCKAKKAEDVLLKLLTKAALKPSPFSTFITTRILADAASDAPEQHLVTADVNHVHILRIFDAILNTDEGLQRSRYEINSLVMRNKKGDYGFVKLTDQPLTRPKVFRTDNVFKTVPRSELLEKLIGYLRSEKRAVSFAELCAAGGIRNDQDGIRLIRDLLDSGMICHAPRLGEPNRNILDEFDEKVRLYALDEVPLYRAVCEELHTVRSLLEQYGQGSVQVRLGCVKGISNALTAVFEKCGLEQSSLKSGGLLYEESFGTAVRSSAEFLQTVHQKTFEQIFDLSLLFDGNILMQQLFAEQFRSVYGEDARMKMENSKIWSMLVKSNTEFQYLWQNGWDVRMRPEYPAEISRLLSLKQKFRDYLLSLKGDTVHLDEKVLEHEFLDEIPEYIRNRRLSYTFFLQKSDDALVINDQFTGYLYNHCRYYDFFPENKAFSDYISHVFDGSEKIAENYETYGFNANCHRPISMYRFLNGNSIGKDQDFGFRETVSLEDSEFFYDPAEKRVCLYHEKIGRYKPVCISSMATFYLPGVLPALNNNSTAAMGLPDLKNIYFDEQTDHVQMIPRIMLGNVVLSRRAWFVRTEWLPKPEDGIAALHAWLDEHRIDKEVFVKAVYFEKTGDMLLKPQYISFRNPLLIEEFYKMTEGYRNILLEEVYPAVSQAEDYVREYLFEITKQ